MTLMDKSIQLSDVQKAFSSGSAAAQAAFQSSVSQVSSVNGKTGSVTLAKADVGLGNVDNTSDANKPVSTAQATAIDAKMGATLPALQTVFDGGTAAQKATFQASVSGGVLLTTTAAIADTGPRAHLTPGRITDGDEAGTPVVWWSPSGSGGFWGYDISPADKFGV